MDFSGHGGLLVFSLQSFSILSSRSLSLSKEEAGGAHRFGFDSLIRRYTWVLANFSLFL